MGQKRRNTAKSGKDKEKEKRRRLNPASADQGRGETDLEGSTAAVVPKRPGSLPKKTFALLVSYVGSGFHGLQKQTADGMEVGGLTTIESLLEKALAGCGAISPDNFGSLQKIGWTRAARTDKGVHAACNVVSAKLAPWDRQAAKAAEGGGGTVPLSTETARDDGAQDTGALGPSACAITAGLSPLASGRAGGTISACPSASAAVPFSGVRFASQMGELAPFRTSERGDQAGSPDNSLPPVGLAERDRALTLSPRPLSAGSPSLQGGIAAVASRAPAHAPSSVCQRSQAASPLHPAPSASSLTLGSLEREATQLPTDFMESIEGATQAGGATEMSMVSLPSPVSASGALPIPSPAHMLPRLIADRESSAAWSASSAAAEMSAAPLQLSETQRLPSGPHSVVAAPLGRARSAATSDPDSRPPGSPPATVRAGQGGGPSVGGGLEEGTGESQPEERGAEARTSENAQSVGVVDEPEGQEGGEYEEEDCSDLELLCQWKGVPVFDAERRALKTLAGRLRDLIEEVNSRLPPSVRLTGLVKVPKSFDARLMCSWRRYEYLLPVYALRPVRLIKKPPVSTSAEVQPEAAGTSGEEGAAPTFDAASQGAVGEDGQQPAQGGQSQQQQQQQSRSIDPSQLPLRAERDPPPRVDALKGGG